jgi:hypothetical protein
MLYLDTGGLSVCLGNGTAERGWSEASPRVGGRISSQAPA